MAGTARSQSTDPFSLTRFHVADTEGFLNLGTPSAGFNAVTMPEMSIGHVEYQEGLWTYRRKYPGEVTFNTITLSKGVMKNDSAFYQWARAGAEHKAYRTNLIIKHYHRDDVSGLVEYKTAKPWRIIEIFNAIPSRVKMGGDLDGLSHDISLEEMDVDYEFFRYKINGVEIKAK